jgi:hypothetical protein
VGGDFIEVCHLVLLSVSVSKSTIPIGSVNCLYEKRGELSPLQVLDFPCVCSLTLLGSNNLLLKLAFRQGFCCQISHFLLSFGLPPICGSQGGF